MWRAALLILIRALYATLVCFSAPQHLPGSETAMTWPAILPQDIPHLEEGPCPQRVPLSFTQPPTTTKFRASLFNCVCGFLFFVFPNAIKTKQIELSCFKTFFLDYISNCLLCLFSKCYQLKQSRNNLG